MSLLRHFKNTTQNIFAYFGRQIVPLHSPFLDFIHLLDSRQVKCVIDGGAYHGTISRQLSKLFPRAQIYAFEPSSQSYQEMIKNTRSFVQIKPLNLALSSSCGSRTFYATTYEQTSALTPPGDAGKKYFPSRTKLAEVQTVSTITLDEWAIGQHVQLVDLIKLDLEGHELEALKGAASYVLPRTKVIYSEIRFVEIHQGCCFLWDMVEYLKNYNFHLYNLYHLGSDPTDGQLLWGDAVFINKNFVGLMNGM
jgi:FkbM family methyltransferase